MLRWTCGYGRPSKVNFTFYIREGVLNAVSLCRKAGIKVIMVTGDQTLTAASIAFQIGIIQSLDETPEVIMYNQGITDIEEAEKRSNVIILFILYRLL